jgi:hypothetical protein
MSKWRIKEYFGFCFASLVLFVLSSVRVEQRFAIENLCEVSRTLLMKGFSIQSRPKAGSLEETS